MKQLNLFEIAQLKKGAYCCDNPDCLARMFNLKLKAYCKTLDQRLTNQGFRILGWLAFNKRELFKPKIVFADDPNARLDVQKLGYWKFIERTKKSGLWRITTKGERFFKCEIQVPDKLWIYNNQVVDESEIMVNVETVNPRWQEERRDWSLDFIPVRSEMTNNLQLL